ncbi:MAG: hypothetical protein ACI4TW_08875 [Prevotella sp.]
MKTKKILYSVFALALAAFTFTACEDVPEPYRIPGQNGTTGEASVILPAGEGTLDSPYNVAAVIDYIQNNETLDQKVYIKGIISQIVEIDYTSYGNAKFYISDDGTTNNEFYIYRCYSLNNGKFKSADEIKVGDEVVIYGNVTIYNGTYETEQNMAYIYSINGNTGEGGGGTTTGEDEYLNADFSTSLAGFTSVSVSGSLTWYTDYSSAMITGYKDYDGDGAKENQAAVTFLVGPEIEIPADADAQIVINHAVNYERADINNNNSIVISKDYAGDVNTATWQQLNYSTDGLGSSFTFKDCTVDVPAEFVGCKIVVALRHTCSESASSTWEVKSLIVKKASAEEGGSEEGGSEESTPIEGETATISKVDNIITITYDKATASSDVVTCDLNAQGWENNVEPTAVTLSDGTTISFAQEESTNAPKYYTLTKGVRMYALNSMTIAGSKAIASVKLTCDVQSTTIYVGNELLYTTVNGNTWKVVNHHTANSGGTQLRIQTIEITYAQ